MFPSIKVGSVKRPFLFIYRALIRTTIEHDTEVYFNSAGSSLQLVEKIQNDSLKLRSKALQSTPNNCLQHHCNKMPVKIKFKQLCLYYRVHLCTFASDLNHPTSANIKKNWQERFQENPNFTSFNIMTKHFLNFLRFR